jgi:hypothetical protein
VTAGYFIPDNRVMVGVSTCVAAALHSCVGIGSSLILNQCLIFHLIQLDSDDALTGARPLRLEMWVAFQGMAIASI